MAGQSVTYTALPGIPHIRPGDDLAETIIASLPQTGLSLQHRDILVIAQKIVSKAEGRFVDLNGVTPSSEAMRLAELSEKDPRLVEVILAESQEILRCQPGLIVAEHRLGFIMANAGIDRSNIEQEPDSERVLLLPANPDGTCEDLKAKLEAEFDAEIGVIVNDSFGRPFRNGVVGVALGAAGVPSLRDMIGSPDLFGRPLHVTQIAVADELAAAASLMMGQASEGQPVIHIRGFSWDAPPAPASKLLRAKHLDVFR